MESLKMACYLAAVLFIATQADGSFNPTEEEIDDFESEIDQPIVKAFNTTWNILKGSNNHGEKKEKESGEENEGSERSAKREGSKKKEHGSKSSEKKKNSGNESKKGGSSSESSKFETKGSLTSSKSAKSSSKEKSLNSASSAKSSESDAKIKLSKSGSSSSSFNSKGKESKNGGKGSDTIITKGSSGKGSKTIGYGSGSKSGKSSSSATIAKGSATVVKGSSKIVKGSTSAGKDSVTQKKGSVSSGKGSSSSKINGKGSRSVGSLSIAATKDFKAKNAGSGSLLAKLSAKLMDKGSKSSGAGSSSSKYSSSSVSKGSSSKSESSSSNVKSSSSKSDSSSYVVNESFSKSGSSGKGSKGSSKFGKGSKSKVPLTRVGSGCSTCAKGSHANGKLPGLYMILAGSSKVSNLIANESGLLSTPTGKGSTINSSSDKIDNSPNVSKAKMENQEGIELNSTNTSAIVENQVANLVVNDNSTSQNQNMTNFDNGKLANCTNCTQGNLTVNGSSTLGLNDGSPENVTNDTAKSQVANLVVKDNLPEHNVSKAEVEGMAKANEDKKLNCTKSPAMKRHAKVTGRSNDNETLDANYLTNTSKTAYPNDTTYNSLAPMVNNSSVNDDLTMANDTMFGNTTMTLDDIGLNATEKVSSSDSSNATTTTTPPGHLPIQSKIP